MTTTTFVAVTLWEANLRHLAWRQITALDDHWYCIGVVCGMLARLLIAGAAFYFSFFLCTYKRHRKQVWKVQLGGGLAPF